MIWIQKHLKIILAVLSAFGFVLFGVFLAHKGAKTIEVPARPDLKTEIRAIKAEADVKKLEAQLGAEHARAQVEAEHKETLEQLNASQKKEAEALRQDPAKLAMFLVRAGKRA